MVDIKLKELNLKMGKKEYEMYQDIPAKENGSTNLAFGIPYENFNAFLENQMARKFNKISYFDTPTIIYIIYTDKKPIGYIGFRTRINKDWKNWCGNIFYVIRKSERNKGYATQALSQLIKIANKMGYKKLYIKASENNVASEKVILKNHFQRVDNDGHFILRII